MKKIITLILLFAIGISAYSQELRFSYHFDNPQIKQINDYQLITFKNTKILAAPSEPSLPFMPVKLLLPVGAELDSFKIVFKNKKYLDGQIVLYPRQAIRPVSFENSNDFIKNEKTYSQSLYPQKKYGNFKTYLMNGFPVVLGSFTPVEFYPKDKKLAYYQDVEIILYYTKSDKISQNLNTKPEVLKKVDNFVQNKGDIYKFSLPQKNKTTNYDVLIITSSTFASSFDSLKNLYLKRGFITNVQTVENINSSVSGADLQEKIRNYIIQEYQNNGIEYVLLGGDVSIIPPRGFYCRVYSPHGTTDSIVDDNIPADLYYSALDGTWNDDGDDRWAEPGEDDLLPEVAVGRLPFETSSELNNMLNKIYAFSERPIINELNKSLLAGEYLYDNPETWGGDYLDLLIGYHEDNGYTTNGIPEDFPYYKLYQKYQSWSGSDLINMINSGYPIVHHVGHSNTDYMMQLYSGDITDANFSGANGNDHNYVIVYSHGCYCGQFDADDCIAEESMKIQNFAVAELVNSRYGWFDEGLTEGPSEHLHREYVDALYTDKEYHLGAAEVISKAETAPFVGLPDEWEPGAQRWVFYDHNVLGDPVMGVWTDIPYEINVYNYDVIPITGTDITVTKADGTPIENAVCVVIQNNQIIGKGYTNSSGVASITLSSDAQLGNAKVFVSGYNILVHEFDAQIVDNAQAYISLNSYELIDNQNNEPNYDENINLNLHLKNIGSVDAQNVYVQLSKGNESDNYTITNSTATIGTIAANQIVENNDLAIKIYYPENGEKDTLILKISFNKTEIERKIILTYKTPEFGITEIQLQEINGNNNGYPEPGETIQLTYVVKNTGDYQAAQGEATYSSATSDITLLNGSQSVKALAAGDTAHLNVKMLISENAQNTDTADLFCFYKAENYQIKINSSFVLGPISEDFETGDFSKFDWQMQGDNNWQIVSNKVHTGNFAAASGDITDEQTSSLSITLNVASDSKISFYQLTSSESGYDFLKFYIDGQKIDEWSGDNTSWSYEEFSVNSGIHTFTWSYEKDMSVSENDDKAYLDDINFPFLINLEQDNITDTTITVINLSNQDQIKVYPNPFKNILTFEIYSTKQQKVILQIFNTEGKQIFSKKYELISGQNFIIISPAIKQSGLYLYQIKGKKFYKNGIILKQ